MRFVEHVDVTARILIDEALKLARWRKRRQDSTKRLFQDIPSNDSRWGCPSDSPADGNIIYNEPEETPQARIVF